MHLPMSEFKSPAVIMPNRTGASCCTCASLLSDVPRLAPGTEKPLPDDRMLPCCERIICGNCMKSNPRFAHYCPYCQTSTSSALSSVATVEEDGSETLKSHNTQRRPPTALLEGALDEPPPPYSPASEHRDKDLFISESDTKINKGQKEYDSHCALLRSTNQQQQQRQEEVEEEDVLHFLDHPHDSIPSLSLRYDVPAPVLRRANNLHSDHLLAGRRTLLVPASHYKGGVSLSPRPVEGEEEERRKARVRRFMVACKVSDYDVATVYLEQAGYDLELAVERYRADEAWEKAHPLRGQVLAKGKAEVKSKGNEQGGKSRAIWKGGFF